MAFDLDTQDADEQSDAQDQRELAQVMPSAPLGPPGGTSAFAPAPSPTPGYAPPQQTALTPPPAYRPPAKFDAASAKSTGDTFSFPPGEPAEPAGASTWKDMKEAFWQGILGQGKDILGAAKFATDQMESDPAIKSHIEDARAVIADQIDKSTQSMSQAGQKTMRESVLGYAGMRDKDGNAIPTPGENGLGRYLGLTVAQALPTVLLAIVPASLMSKVAVKALSVAGVATEAAGAAGEVAATTAARVAATTASTGTTATLFGTQNAGAVYNEISDQLAKASPKDLMTSPVYAQAIASGKSDGEARAEVLKQSAWAVGAAAAVGAATGVGVGGVLHGGPLTAGRGLVARTAIGGTEGAVTMGAQGGANTALTQQAVRGQVDLPSVLADAAASGVQGAGLGAVGGVFHPGEARARGTPEAEPPPPPPPPPGVAPDVHTALRDQLELDLTQAPPGPVAGSPQGELFRTADQAQQPRPEPPPEPPPPSAPPPAPPAPPAPAQGELPMQAAPGLVPGSDQGELFRTPDQAQPAPPEPPAPPPPPQAPVPTPPGAALPRAAAPVPAPDTSAPRPSAGMKRQDLVDALSTMPGQDPRAIKAMSAKDLAARYDQLASREASTTVVTDSGSAVPPNRESVAPKVLAGPEGETAPPPSTQGVGSLPVAAETGAATPDVTTPTPTPPPRKSDAPISEGPPRRTTVAPDAFQAPKATVAAVETSKTKGRKPPAKQVVVIPKTTETRAYVAPETEAETRPPVDTQAVEEARSDRVQDLAEAVRVIPGARGSALEPVLRKAQRFLAEQIGKTDGSRDAVAELIHNWMESEPAKPYPGTRVTAKALGEHFMERVAGQKPIDREGAARADVASTRQEDAARRGPSSKTVTGEHIESATGTESAGGTTSVTPVVTERGVTEHVDRKRVADDLIEKLLDPDDSMTAQQADAHYGKPVPGPGRPRRWAVLADRVRERIEEAKDPDGLRERAILIDQSNAESDPKLTPKEREVRTKANERALRSVGPEAEAKLNDILRQLEDPVGKAADDQDLATQREKVRARTAELEARNRGQTRDPRDDDMQASRAAPDKPGKMDPIQDNPNLLPAYKDYMARLEEARAAWFRRGTAKILTDQARDRLQDPNRSPHSNKFWEDSLAKNEPELARLDAILEAFGHDPNSRRMPRDEWTYSGRQTRIVEHGHTTSGGIDPRSSRYYASAVDQRVGASLTHLLQTTEARGETLTAHQAYRLIAEDPLIRSESPALAALARKLIEVSPDIPVYSGKEAMNRNLMSKKSQDEFIRGNLYGYHSIGQHEHIMLGIENNAFARTHAAITMLHEGLHGATQRYIRNLEANDPNHVHLQALKLIAREMAVHAPRNIWAIDAAEKGGMSYGASNIHEVVTEMLSNPMVQAAASTMRGSPEFRAAMTKRGFAPREARSVWSSFVGWVRKALSLGTPRSASEYSMLDYALRPIQDIVDQGAQFNKERNAGLLPKDPALHAAAEPLYSAISDAGRDSYARTADYVRREAPYMGSSVIDRTRPATLTATNMDQIVPRYGDVFQPSDRLAMPAGNPLVRVRDAGEAIAHRAKQFLDTFTDANNARITSAKSLNPTEQENVGKLLNDATIANAHLAPGANNSHLTTPEQQATLAALQARFAALSPKAREVEQSVVKAHADMDKVEREAKVEGILASVFPEANEAQREAFRQITSSKARLEKFLADPDTSAIAKEYGPAWADKVGELTKLSAQAIHSGWQLGDFVPLRRHGDYAIAYGEHGTPSEGFERFETRGQAEERYAQLARDPTIKETLRNVDFARDDNALGLVLHNNPLIERFNAALERRPDLAPKADEIRDLMSKIVLESMARSDASRMRRRGIQGASLDFTRVLAKETQDTAARTGYFAHGGERYRALNDMGRIADDLAKHGEPGQSRIARQVIDEVSKHVTAQENPGGATAALARRASTFGYMQSLASFSHLATSTIENYSMAMPQLAARYGIGRTTFELGRVGKSLVAPMFKTGGANMLKALGNKLKASDWNVSDVLAKHLKESGFQASHVDAVFNMLKRTGLVDHSYARELNRLANPEGVLSKTGRVVDYFNNLMGVWSHSVDAVNRANVAMSAFNLELAKSHGDMAKALVRAEEHARIASPNYNLANKNRFSTSAGPLKGLAGPVTQFKQYGFFAYGVLGNAIKQSLAKLPSEQRKEARYALAGMIATHALTAGLLGTPLADGIRYFGGLYDWMTGADKPHDREADLRGFLNNQFGPEMGQLIARGAIDTLAGTSVHRRVSFANVLEIPALESFDMAGVLKMVGTAMVGASGEDATKFANGMQAMLQGDVYGGLKSMIPRPVRDVMTANELATQGVKTQRGRTILPAENITPWDVAVQAAGFQPSRVSEAREGSAAVQQARDEAKSEQTRLSHRWLQAAPEERQNVMQEINLHNQDPRTAGFKVTMHQLLLDEQQQRKRSQMPGAYGLRLPKHGAQQLIDAGSFANVQ